MGNRDIMRIKSTSTPRSCPTLQAMLNREREREREREGESTHHVLHTTRLASPVRVYGCRAEGMPVGVHHLGTGWAQFPGAAFPGRGLSSPEPGT